MQLLIEKIEVISSYLLVISSALPLPFMLYGMREDLTLLNVVWIIGITFVLVIFPTLCIAISARVHVKDHSNLAFALVLFFGFLYFLGRGYMSLAALSGFAGVSGDSFTIIMYLLVILSPLLFNLVTVAAAIATALIRETQRNKYSARRSLNYGGKP